MTHETFDFLVVGGGSAGYAAARTARETVERVAIVDAAEELGGLCILRGCMPSKTLIYAAEVLHRAHQGSRLGLRIPDAAADMGAMQRRKRRIIAEFADYRKDQLESDRFTLFRSRARFCGPDTVELDDGRRLSAHRILIATGSTVAVPPVPGLAGTPFWTSDDILDLEELPDRIIVLGGGIVACELSQFLARAGSEVVQIQRSPHILKELPASAAAVVEGALRDDGVHLATGTRLVEVAHDGSVFTVRYQAGGEERTLSAPRLLNALGRRPLTDGLGLAAAGIETTPGGHIRCDAFQQTSNPSVYAAGDVAGPHEIVHVAILQGETAARHATGRPARPVDEAHLLSVVFTDPQVAVVGRTCEAGAGPDGPLLSAEYPFADHGKSILMEAASGYVKVCAERPDGRIVGAECVGRDAGELIHSLSVAVALGASVHDLLRTHWYHPTLSEIWTYPLEEIAEQLAEDS